MLIFSFLMVAQVVLADTPADSKGKNYGLDTTAQTGLGVDKTKIENSSLSSIIGTIVGAALAFLGIVFFILMIMGGFTWMTSMGNEQSAAKAKDIIMAAVIGLVIVLLAYAITKLISGIF